MCGQQLTECAAQRGQCLFAGCRSRAKKQPSRLVIPLQMHNGGLLDEYRNVRVEIDPEDDRLITAE
jgi:hypothetical protein